VTEKSGKLRNNLKKGILTAVSCIRNKFAILKSEVESTSRRIVDLEARASETHSILQALLDGVGGNRREEQEATSISL
jgi:hypothetical protein